MNKETKQLLQKQMREWIIKQGGYTTKQERARKWHELEKKLESHKKIIKQATEKATKTKARRKELADKFKKYRPIKDET